MRTCFESLVALYVVSVLRGTTTLADPLQTAQDMRNHKEVIKNLIFNSSKPCQAPERSVLSSLLVCAAAARRSRR